MLRIRRRCGSRSRGSSKDTSSAFSDRATSQDVTVAASSTASDAAPPLRRRDESRKTCASTYLPRDARSRQARRGRLVQHDVRPPRLVDAAAARRIHVMMEKPLAVSMEPPSVSGEPPLRAASTSSSLRATWYREPRCHLVAVEGNFAPPERFAKWWQWTAITARRQSASRPSSWNWLADPVRNGGGALYAWLLRRESDDVDDGQSASGRRHRNHTQFQPDVYRASTTIDDPGGNTRKHREYSASWNWPVGQRISRCTENEGWPSPPAVNGLRVALPNEREHAVTPEPLPPDERDPIRT